MSKILFGVIVVLGLSTLLLWYQNAQLVELNQAFELRDKEQKEAINSLQQDFELQTQGLKELQKKSNEAQLEMNRYFDIFKRHNLTKLANAKPNLIETRANNGTKKVFDSIEEISRVVDNLDDGLQLQSSTE